MDHYGVIGMVEIYVCVYMGKHHYDVIGMVEIYVVGHIFIYIWNEEDQNSRTHSSNS